MNPGTSVRLISDPGRHGITTGRERFRGGRKFIQIKFPDSHQFIAELQLEIVQAEVEDAYDLFCKGKFGRARDLRGAITHIRLSGRLADLIYSMETTHTDFYPYQFKPVLNFLESPSGGILVADEVGLGKTIEAGLIWTELRSRYDTRRLMVLSPAMLREKWKFELQRRFGIKADIVDANETLQVFKEYRNGDINDFAIVSSMQGLRPIRHWEDDDTLLNKAAVRLSRFLSENAHDEPLLDLLIIDEAHYLRNPESMTSKLGRLLRDVANHVVLLSATPIHLKSIDLFHLLNLVDEDSFNQVHVFDDILTANAPLIKAKEMILGGDNNPESFLKQLQEAQDHVLLSENRQLKAIIDNPPTESQLTDNTYRSRLANHLENINLLGRAVSRTRKREVTEWRVVREAVPERIELTPVEEEFYAKVTSLVRQYCLESNAHEGFLLVTPQRQISSSMPAALREWKHQKYKHDQIYEDLGDDNNEDENIGPLVRTIFENAEELGNLQELWDSDSKYQRLSSELKKYLKSNPKDKIVIFAYFRPTLYYLHERLGSEGFSSLVIVGGGTRNKYEVMEEFKDPKGPNILLASEVASEGVDLQFSRVLVNYDLPWNPMKVEQRIGRIDRLGQMSPVITIWNLFYANTIDERIYERLFKRLNIFEHTLGGLEAVLGEEIKRLTLYLLKGQLTPEQEESRISQTQQALSNLIEEERKLEKNANNLIAHGDYILNQVKAAKELGRCINGQDLWIYVRDFFNAFYPGCEFRQVENDNLVFKIKLSESARSELEIFIKNNHLSGQTRILQMANRPMLCEFKNQVSQQLVGENEYINQFHPLIRFVSYKIQKEISQSETIYFPSVSIRLNSKDLPTLFADNYLFYVERWTVRGVRDIEKMVYFARPLSGNSNYLNEKVAEQLVTSAAKQGRDWLAATNMIDVEEHIPLVEDMMDRTEQEYHKYISDLQNENYDRADLQEKTLRLHMQRQQDKLNDVLERHREKANHKMIAPTQGLIDKMRTRLENKISAIQKKRELQHHRAEVCLGIVQLD